MSSTDEKLVALVEKQARALRTLEAEVQELRAASEPEPEPEPEPAIEKPWSEMSTEEKVAFTDAKYGG